MGRPVSFDFTTGGGSPEEFLMGVVYLEPTLMHTIGSTVVLPDAPYPVKLVNGKAVHPDVAVSPAGPEPAWAYRVTIKSELTGKSWSEFRGVPTGTTQIAYKDLTKFVTTIPPQTTAGMMQNWADTTEANAERSEIAADRAEAPTDLMNKNLIENSASLTAGALSAAIAQSTGDGNLSDFVNSWWCVPRSVYNEMRGCFYQGGVNRDGMMQVAKFDLRRKTVSTIDLGLYEKDDHNVPAFLFEDDMPPIVAIVRHSVESFVRIRVGAKPHDIESLESAPEVLVPFAGTCTYAHLIRRPTDSVVALLTRNADGWHVAVSRDWGATWEPSRRFHGMGYATFRQVGHIVHYAATVHPVTVPNTAIRYFKIDAVTGDVTTAHSETPIGNLWLGEEFVPGNSMTVVVQSYDPETHRTFDIGRGGSIAAMKFNKNTPESGGTYGVYRHKAGGSWDWEPIVASGVPVGYYESSYVGGMAFGGNDDSVWLAREASGNWFIERWTKEGGIWAKSDTIRTSTGHQLGRPQIPWGAEGSGLFTAIDYWRYPSNSFMDYYGDQTWKRTGIAETVIPAPALPDVPPLPDPAPPEELLNAGSVLLIDATQWTAGVPTSTVPNLAGGTLDVDNTLLGTDGAAERTSKGGMHVAISQTTAGLDKHFELDSPTIRDYLAANPTHSYYIGVTAMITRHTTAVPPNAGSHRMVGVWGEASNDTLTVRPVTGNKVSVVPSTNRTSYKETAVPAPLGEPFIVDGAVSQVPPVGSNHSVVTWNTGRIAGDQQSGFSWVLYAAYIEDLTVSGRTYTQASTLYAQHHAIADVAGDTFTAPATLAP